MPKKSSELSSLGMNFSSLLDKFKTFQGNVMNIPSTNNHAIIGDWKKLGLIDTDSMQITPLGEEILDSNKAEENSISIPYMILFYSLDGRNFPFFDLIYYIYDQFVEQDFNEIVIDKEEIGNFLKDQGYYLGGSSEKVRLGYIMSYIKEIFNKNYKLSKLFTVINNSDNSITIKTTSEGIKLLALFREIYPQFKNYNEYLEVIKNRYSLHKILTLIGNIE